MNNIVKKYFSIVTFVFFSLSSIAFAEPVTRSMVEDVVPTCLKMKNRFEKQILEKQRAKAAPSQDDVYETESKYEPRSISEITELKDVTLNCPK